MAMNCENVSDKQRRWKDSIPSSAVHLIAGGLGATVAAISTCPLEVVQTRLQSSLLNFSNIHSVHGAPTLNLRGTAAIGSMNVNVAKNVAFRFQRLLQYNYLTQLFSYMRFMVKTEGPSSLFKGLLPSAAGVAPAKSIYFLVYSEVKSTLNDSVYFESESRPVFTLAAVCAGLTTSTFINPIWYVKTHLQLHNDNTHMTISSCVRNAYRSHGLRAFFRGMSASYVGVFETIIYFIIYEDVKKKLKYHRGSLGESKFHSVDYVIGSVVSKLTATLVMYPHEVIRTRLRQYDRNSNGRIKYRNFLQTLATVGREEGILGLYGGFGTNIMRQVPSTAITFLAYETIINFFEEDS